MGTQVQTVANNALRRCLWIIILRVLMQRIISPFTVRALLLKNTEGCAGPPEMSGVNLEVQK
jgi:hypothetical protein